MNEKILTREQAREVLKQGGIVQGCGHPLYLTHEEHGGAIWYQVIGGQLWKQRHRDAAWEESSGKSFDLHDQFVEMKVGE